MFERTLQDLIRGLRAHKASSRAQEESFLAEAMAEIRKELKGKDMQLKAEGVLKMCYLMMLYPIPAPAGFAFNVVETMSSPRYHLKQLGYMVAPMAFSGDSEEVVLTVNSIKKDLQSPHLAIPALPLSALPHLLSLSPSLAHTLHPDLLVLLTHSSARIRKRAVLCLLPCWEAFPDGLREGFPRLRERLLDEDQGVVGATVSVVMELARRQGGSNYLPLAPELFTILTKSSNNWMLIKVVKLFALLTPLEPRLVRKLLPPLTALISSTSAISLLYECVRTCIVGGMLDPDREEGEALARVCVEKLGGYLRDEGGDQNLRYIALLAMVKITPTHPYMVAEYQDEILASLDDADLSIRMRALELVTAMVDRGNLRHIVDELLTHLAPPEEEPSLPSAMSSLAAAASKTKASDATVTAQNISQSPSYRLLLSQRVLAIIAHDTYLHVSDFEWVVSVLVDIAYVSHVDIGNQVHDMLLDVVARVKSVRGYAVKVLERVVADDEFRDRIRDKSGEDGLLRAAVWICGEYSSELHSPLSTISALLTPSLAQAPSAVVALSLHAAAKVFGHYAATISSSWSADLHEECKNVVASIRSGAEPFLYSADIEVQERAVELTQLLAFVNADLNNHTPPKPSAPVESIPGVEGGFEDDSSAADNAEPPYPKSLFLFEPLFTSHELNSVAYMAQEAVRIPDGIDLDKPIVPNNGFAGIQDDDDAESEDEKQDVDLGEGGGAGMEELRRVLRDQERKGKKTKGKGKKPEGDLTAAERAERLKKRASKRERARNDPYYLYDKKDDDDDIDDIPIVRLDDSELAAAEAPAPTKVKSKKKRAPVLAPPPEFDRNGEMPEGAAPVAPAAVDARPKSGLAAVDLRTPGPAASRPTGRYDEYDEDGLPPRSAVATPAPATPAPVTPAESPSIADAPADEAQAVKVVKVKRKKKRAAV
ncbi:AP-3 complex subunit delta [Vanrija albida]|uniref:AP-3 complex subunit delta n=1 Tax=Vanrija albida TaxID=181172 RepID=A0ABR3Q0W0_9TREE